MCQRDTKQQPSSDPRYRRSKKACKRRSEAGWKDNVRTVFEYSCCQFRGPERNDDARTMFEEMVPTIVAAANISSRGGKTILVNC